MTGPERTADGDLARADVCWAYGEARDAAFLIILRAQQYAKAIDDEAVEAGVRLHEAVHALDEINARIRRNLGEEA